MSKAQVEDYLDQFDAIQQEILARLSDLDRGELLYATTHSRWNTVRRVLLRFGDHVREHTTQLVAAREEIDARSTMSQRMLARAIESYGLFLGACVGLDDRSLDLEPEAGEWTPRQIIEHVINSQKQYLELIERARETRQPVERD